MKYLVNRYEMQQYDKNTSETLKVPALILMEQAALGACEEIEAITEKYSEILFVCGVGNNGGDGLAVARMLFLKGYRVDIVLLGDKEKASEQNAKQQEILAAYGVELLDEFPEKKSYHVVVDALFGVGLTRTVEGIYRDAIEEMNSMKGYKVALDIPSGVNADNGSILGAAFRADMTITFAFDKVGLHLWPGNEKTGRIIVKKIGITEHSFLKQLPEVSAIEEKDMELLRDRPSHSNKGTFGKVLVIAGSVNMAGAAILAGKGAYAAGCGLVRILTPEENRVIIQTSLPEAILTTYSSENADEKIVTEAIKWADAILIGPGIGMNATAECLLRQVIAEAKVPVILDADALNLAARNMEVLNSHKQEMIVTPHLGEMSRLTGESIAQLQANLVETAKTFATTYQTVCVLKDERTIIGTKEGRVYMNLTGNAGMATAGSGDVLAGIIASLTAQGHNCEKAVALGVYLHGAAGDYMVKEIGMPGLIASDIIRGVHRILGCKDGKNGIL